MIPNKGIAKKRSIFGGLSGKNDKVRRGLGRSQNRNKSQVKATPMEGEKVKFSERPYPA